MIWLASILISQISFCRPTLQNVHHALRCLEGGTCRCHTAISLKSRDDKICLSLLEQALGIPDGIPVPRTLVKWPHLANSINQKSAAQYGNQAKGNTRSASELELGINPESPDGQNQRKNYDVHVRLTKKAEPPPTRGVNRDSGTASANGGWLRRLVRRQNHHNSISPAILMNVAHNARIALIKQRRRPFRWDNLKTNSVLNRNVSL